MACRNVHRVVLAWLTGVILILLAASAIAADTELPFNARSLVEVRTLAALPRDITSMFGWHKTGVQGIADAKEKFNTTDLADSHLPQRRFIVGGASSATALVAYEDGGRSRTIHAAAFTLSNSGWDKVGEWTLDENPVTLHGLLEIVDSKNYPNGARQNRSRLISDRIRQTQPDRRNGPLREANLSDNEVREIQAIAFRIFPGAILNISGVVTGCPCEEGPACADQVWVVARSGGHTNGLQLSRIGGRWAVGVVQQWWLNYQKLQADRTLPPGKRYDALQAMHDNFPACTEGPG
jgi:hypothetical protein